jgi:DNA (cytosine-5)-methyltransferase 1
MCTGYGGLDMAVQQVFGGEIAWHAELDPDAAKVLAHRYPDVPNLGDITAAPWQDAVRVDLVCAGFPCQDISYAGRGEGIQEGNRSGLWHTIADALSALRPRFVMLENVRAIVARRPGLDVVLADLARLGFDAEWTCLRASDVGAPHQRWRWFLCAWATDADGPAPECGVPAADAPGDGRDEGRPEPAGQLRRPDAALGSSPAPADTDSNAVREQPVTQPGRGRTAVADQHRPAAADTDRDGLPRRPERDRPALSGQGGHEQRRVDPLRCVLDWGPYEPAVRRWEHATGRPAPRPTEPGRSGERLSPVFVEWMMGLPAGHVTDVPGISRNAQLRLLGNGVVPQQGAAALAWLWDRAEAA